MGYLSAKAIAGVLTAGVLGAGGYLTYNSFSIKTIGDELLSENSENRLLENGDDKWEKREEKYKKITDNVGDNNPRKINGFTISESESESESEKGVKLRSKCESLWNSSKGDSNSSSIKEDLKNWCLVSSTKADSQ